MWRSTYLIPRRISIIQEHEWALDERIPTEGHGLLCDASNNLNFELQVKVIRLETFGKGYAWL